MSSEILLPFVVFLAGGKEGPQGLLMVWLCKVSR